MKQTPRKSSRTSRVVKKKPGKNLGNGVLRVASADLSAVLSAMTDVVMVLNSEGRYLEIVPTNPNLLYKPADQLLGRTLHENFPQPKADEMLGYIRRALKTGDTVHSEYCLTIEGKDVWFNAAISPLANDSVVWSRATSPSARSPKRPTASKPPRWKRY